jgi:hypothetical protein
MVFESVDQAAQYREYACALRASVPDIITLCGGKLSGRGVVMGSSFRVVPVAEAAYRFGTIPAGQQVRGSVRRVPPSEHGAHTWQGYQPHL